MTKRQSKSIPRKRNETKSQVPSSSNKKKSKSQKEKEVTNMMPIRDKYRIARYQKVIIGAKNPKSNNCGLEVEGVLISSRGFSGKMAYIECSSARRRNAPDCFFRARIIDYETSNLEGNIDIINEHSDNCKFKLGNNTKDFNKNKNLSSSKINYKTMKIEVEKKLEDENWLTPSEVLEWIKTNFDIQNHLSYQQVEEIISAWRKKTCVTKEFYILQNTLNKTGLPFLRAYLNFFYKKASANKSLKLVTWASDFQINRLRLTNHWYCDGTFTVAPVPYTQLITIAIKDPNTGYVKPAMWALLDNKEEEGYYHLFKTIKDIVSENNKTNWNLQSITLDFETALQKGFSANFSGTRIIGCLFHFKQALYREAQSLSLTKAEFKDETIELISKLGSLSWKNQESIQRIFNEIQVKYEKTKHGQLVDYYRKFWLEKLKNGLIDYSDVEDSFRANSVLERYNGHIKDSLPRCASWPKFLEFIRNEEASYVRESHLAEQKGETIQESMKFGQTYLPKGIKKTRNGNKSNELRGEEEKIQEGTKVEIVIQYPNKRKTSENMNQELIISSKKLNKQTKLNVSLNANDPAQNKIKDKIKIILENPEKTLEWIKWQI